MIRHIVSLALGCLLVIVSFIGTSPAAAAAATTQNRPSARRSSTLTSPRAHLGFAPGTSRTIADWRQITNYFQLLDRESPQVQVESIGKTTLGRDLLVAYISAPENIRDLAKYKDIQRRLADPRLIRTEPERNRLIAEGRAIVVISCSIHSTEIVASQMAMQLAYDLANAPDPETQNILRNTILLLVPSANPDGVDIIANWYRRTLGTPHEGTEPPELYHHYAGHDNNRDWYMLNLAETRHLTRLFWREWFPQIVYDVHQQGATGSRFFIPPFHEPANPHIAPALLRETGALGYRIAADLQAHGRTGIITNAIYDMWWHGGFRTAPYYHNSIGILSEAASARLMSPITITIEQLRRASSRGMTSALESSLNFPEPWTGGAWRPEDIRDMELIAARTVLREAAQNRARYLRNFHDLGRRALDYPDALDRTQAYIIPPGQGQDEAIAKFVSLLVEQGVEVHRLENELHTTLIGNINSSAQPSRERETPAGSYIIFLAQPYRANIQALFEKQIYPKRIGANGEAERPYDVTGWTLPMQMGIEVEEIVRIREPASERRLKLIESGAQVRRDFGLPAQDEREVAALPIAATARNSNESYRRIGLYRGWVPSMDEGWTRYVFDTHNIPYTTLRDRDMRAGDLRRRFDTIIFASQSPRQIVEGHAAGDYPTEFTGGITRAGVENLRRFVEAGGTLVAFDQSTEFAIKEFNLPVRNVLSDTKPGQFYCPGSILRLTVDTSHPLARKLKPETDAYFINSSAFEITDAGESRVRVVARYAAGDLLRSGYLLGEQLIRNRPALVEVAHGQGQVILFGFRPQHRAQTWATYPFVFNALKN